MQHERPTRVSTRTVVTEYTMPICANERCRITYTHPPAIAAYTPSPSQNHCDCALAPGRSPASGSSRPARRLRRDRRHEQRRLPDSMLNRSSGRAPQAAQERLGRFRRHRAGDEVALDLVAALGLSTASCDSFLDALRRHRELHALRHGDDRGGDGAVPPLVSMPLTNDWSILSRSIESSSGGHVRVAHAEVVDRDPDAERFRPFSTSLARSGLAISAPSVSSSSSRPGSRPLCARAWPTRWRKFGLPELHRGDVHRDALEGESGLHPRARLLACRVQHPVADRHDQPDSSATGMNSSGGTAPSSRSSQRSSASIPQTRPLESSISGW